MKVVSVEASEGLDEKDVRIAIAIEAFKRKLVSVGKASPTGSHRRVEEERYACLQI